MAEQVKPGLRFILFAILMFAIPDVLAHKDRIERPTTMKFLFENGAHVNLTNADKSEIESYSKDILKGNRILRTAELKFATGETIIFTYEHSVLASITITAGKKEAIVPKTTIDKIKDICFNTIALLWDGREQKAFSSSYFYIQFNVGKSALFNSYPYIELFFEKGGFSRAKISTAKRWSDL
jgi:hypothetical protein